MKAKISFPQLNLASRIIKEAIKAIRKRVRLIVAAPDLLEACKAQHDAIDLLFAKLIQLDPNFFPSKSGLPWEAVKKGNAAITKAEPKVEVRHES